MGPEGAPFFCCSIPHQRKLTEGRGEERGEGGGGEEREERRGGGGGEGGKERGREGDEMWREVGLTVEGNESINKGSPPSHTHLLTASMEPFLSFRKSLEQHTSLICG